MLSFSKKNNNNQNLTELKELPRITAIKKLRDFFKYILKFVLSFGIDILSWIIKAVLSPVISPVFASFIAGLFNFWADLGLNIAFNLVDGKAINWSNVGKSALRAAITSTLGLFAIGKGIKKMASFAKQTIGTGSKVLNFANDPINTAIHVIKNGAIKLLAKGSKQVAKFTSYANKLASTAIKSVKAIKSIAAMKNDPLNASKQLIGLFSSKPKQFLHKKLNNFFKLKGNTLNFKSLGKNAQQHKNINLLNNNNFSKNIIIFDNSDWIYGVKPLDEIFLNNNDHIFTYFILFKPEITKNKKMIRREGPALFFEKELADFIAAPSPGRYYLDNIAWGREFGDILKSKKKPYLNYLDFENLKNFENIKKTLFNFENIDSKLYYSRLNYWKNRDFGNYVLREYNTKRGKKILWKKESWIKAKSKNINKGWIRKGTTVKTSNLIKGVKKW